MRRPSPIYLDQVDIIDPERVPHILRRKVPRTAFSWYGGKYFYVNWILPLLPKCFHYCEPFSGAATILINRDPSPIETYNDIDGEIVNFFLVLREQPDALLKALSLTPYSREEYYKAVYKRDVTDSVERARLFYIRVMQTFGAIESRASLGRWARATASRKGVSKAVACWLSGQDKLKEISERLIRVQIENRPAIDVISSYDGPDTLFYCDPPYHFGSRTSLNVYRYEMSDEDHIKLADILNKCKGKVAISGYKSDLMNEWYGKWRRIDAKPKLSAFNGIKTLHQESLWMNY